MAAPLPARETGHFTDDVNDCHFTTTHGRSPLQWPTNVQSNTLVLSRSFPFSALGFPSLVYTPSRVTKRLRTLWRVSSLATTIQEDKFKCREQRLYYPWPESKVVSHYTFSNKKKSYLCNINYVFLTAFTLTWKTFSPVLKELKKAIFCTDYGNV
jgi:hypothetical protein